MLRTDISLSRERAALTVIELVLVMAVVGILTSLLVVAFSQTRVDSKIKRANADLHVIQVGLEQYRGRFGDYPRIPDIDGGAVFPDPVTSNNSYLLNALSGKIGPSHAVVDDVPSMLNHGLLTLSNPEDGYPMEDAVDNELVDPWGHAYAYDYRPKDAGWLMFGYKLYSFGPDGSDDSGEGDDIVAE
ncbi:type II secretion system protein GspG [Pelagicoccus sp. SDUM812003]|uniref:type II secretion system protein GspG n=1 Tax=Pelagicoccus sp. SDUM812003 TaxID=3041267 RepID=UPI00280F4B1F|nr:type II secretion system protein GspG [Pelagicoccus sp. SDUM812003]MDQ8204567.1 type II secretion system protein GspG [Pelagicoccus sp. SDUM812003]